MAAFHIGECDAIFGAVALSMDGNGHGIWPLGAVGGNDPTIGS
jgi:hypothetical protein